MCIAAVFAIFTSRTTIRTHERMRCRVMSVVLSSQALLANALPKLPPTTGSLLRPPVRLKSALFLQ
jgi:hypothetical protein